MYEDRRQLSQLKCFFNGFAFHCCVFAEARKQGLDEVTATAVADKARKDVLDKEMNAIALEKQEIQDYEQRLAAKRAEIRGRMSSQQ